jgi:hypothetical protein
MVLVRIFRVIPKKVGHLRINHVNRPIRKFDDGEEIEKDTGNACLKEISKSTSVREQFPSLASNPFHILIYNRLKIFFPKFGEVQRDSQVFKRELTYLATKHLSKNICLINKNIDVHEDTFVVVNPHARHVFKAG